MATVWASTPCDASTTSSAPSHAASDARDLVGEVHVAGRVDEVELVGLAVLRLVEDADGLGLDRDAALALEVHRVEHLRAHQPRVDGVRQLEDAIGQRRLPVVDVGDDREVADVGGVGHGSSRVEAAPTDGVPDVERLRDALRGRPPPRRPRRPAASAVVTAIAWAASAVAEDLVERPPPAVGDGAEQRRGGDHPRRRRRASRAPRAGRGSSGRRKYAWLSVVVRLLTAVPITMPPIPSGS